MVIFKYILSFIFLLVFCKSVAQDVYQADSKPLEFKKHVKSNRNIQQVSEAIRVTFGFNFKSFYKDSQPLAITVGEKRAEVQNDVQEATIKPQAEVISDSVKTDQHITNYALFIGVSEYTNSTTGFTNLDKPVEDATIFNNTLIANYQFEEEHTQLLSNPTKSEILSSIEMLARSIDSNDNLLIFYAGHGYWDEFLKIGYWLAADAKIDDKSTWLSNSTLRDYIAAIPSKHTLLITDACFGGGIFKTRAAEDVNAYAISKIYKMPSRKALTSGTLTEVPDESVFMKYLIKSLEANEEQYLPVSQLFYGIRPAILNNSKTVPQLGVIQNTGDEGGEFVFIKN